MRKFLIFLSGARADIIEECPSERGKFEGLGATVLIASVLSFVIMVFALTLALGLNRVLAVVVGFIWAVITMSLDRWLVASVRTGDRGTVLASLPRILLGLLFGIILSTPLVLQIFRPEINAQIVAIQQRNASEFQQQVAASPTTEEITRLQQTVANYQNVIASGGGAQLNPELDPTIQDLTKERDQEQVIANAAYKEWQCQLYGGPSCNDVGNGPLAAADEHKYLTAENEVTNLSAAISARLQELTLQSSRDMQFRLAQAREYLPGAEAQLSTDLRAQAAEQQQFDTANRYDTGLLIRLQALDQLSSENITINIVRLLLFISISLIECLPVIIKLMQKPGNYERILALSQQHELRMATYRYGAIGPTTLEQVWDRKSAEVEAPPPVASSTATSDKDSEDRALRNMQDLRSASPPDEVARHLPAG